MSEISNTKDFFKGYETLHSIIAFSFLASLLPKTTIIETINTEIFIHLWPTSKLLQTFMMLIPLTFDYLIIVIILRSYISFTKTEEEQMRHIRNLYRLKSLLGKVDPESPEYIKNLSILRKINQPKFNQYKIIMAFMSHQCLFFDLMATFILYIITFISWISKATCYVHIFQSFFIGYSVIRTSKIMSKRLERKMTSFQRFLLYFCFPALSLIFLSVFLWGFVYLADPLTVIGFLFVVYGCVLFLEEVDKTSIAYNIKRIFYQIAK